MSIGLLRAYRRTHYVVELPGRRPIVLRPGKRHPILDAWLRRIACRHACVLTAWNPGGRLAAEAANRRANRRLEQRLQRRGVHHPSARGVDPDAHWEAESGFLVLHLSPAAAALLAGEFRQKAIVAYSRGACVSLWLTPHGSRRRIRP